MAVRISKPIVVILAISAFVALVVACSGPSWEDPLQPRITWVLESIKGNPILKEAPIYLTIYDSHLGGHDGCNSYGIGDDYGLPISPVISHPDGSYMEGDFSGRDYGMTAAACPNDEVEEQSDAYGDAVTKGKTFRIQGNRLEILDEEGQTTLVFVRQPPFPGHQPDLAGTQWRITDDRDPIILAFLDEETAVAMGSCILWKGRYITSHRLLRFDSMKRHEIHRPCTRTGSFSSFLEAQYRSLWGAEYYSVIQKGGSEKLMVGTRLGESGRVSYLRASIGAYIQLGK